MWHRTGLLALAACIALAGCGSSNGGFVAPPGTGGSGGTGSGSNTGTSGTTEKIEMGTTVNGSFQAGTISSALPAGSQLAAGGNTQLTVSFRSTTTQAPVADDISVSFASQCPAGTVVITPAPAVAQGGTASVTYSYKGGCTLAQDTVTATATLPATTTTPLANKTASVDVALAPSKVGSIEFVSAEPTNIGLQGTGRTENSTITFLVRDSAGGPRPNADVTFALSTSVGGITLQPTTGYTGGDGLVQTVVKAGTVATAVRVTATVQGDSGPISTQSSELTITTGLPDQNSLSLSLEILNPEAYDLDGQQVKVTARLADRFNNPVPDGTAVYFTTEGGKIGGQCTTATDGIESGVCSVTWTSQNPRPADGRVAILATAIGEESFQDLNGNGVFDQGDTFNDEGEPFRDDNGNALHDANEPFYDFNVNGVYDGPDGLYEGLLCQHPTLCGTSTTAGIGTATELVMSGSGAIIEIAPALSGPYTCLAGSVNGCAGTHTLSLPTTFFLRISDARGQVMPAGTVIAIAPYNGTAVGDTAFVQAQSTDSGGTVYEFMLDADGTPSTGPMDITVTTPSGVITRARIDSVTD